jgi:hypothetical protein
MHSHNAGLTSRRKSIDVWPGEILPTNALRAGVQKKRVDYTIGCDVEEYSRTHNILRGLEDHTISQSNHKSLRDRVLFSQLEIKTKSSLVDGKDQLGTWCAAGFNKQKRMWTQRQVNSVTGPPALYLAPAVLWTWTEDVVRFWIAVADWELKLFHGLEEKTFAINETEDLLRVILSMKAVMDWGAAHHLPWVKELIGWDDDGDTNANANR